MKIRKSEKASIWRNLYQSFHKFQNLLYSFGTKTVKSFQLGKPVPKTSKTLRLLHCFANFFSPFFYKSG